MLSSLWEDIRFAARLLARQPGFSASAVLLLALGIGANSAIFSLVDSVLLRPLPYKDLDRIYFLQVRDLVRGRPPAYFSAPEFLEYQGHVNSFAHMAGLLHQSVTLARGGAPVTVLGAFMTRDYLDTIGVPLILGRPFLPEEYDPRKNQATILSESLWRSQFGADPAVVGQTVRLDNEVHLIVGVFPELRGQVHVADLYLPIPYTPDLIARRDTRTMTVLAKLRDGATPAQASEELRAVSRRLAEAYPESNGGLEAYLIPAMNEVRGDAAEPLGVLAVAVGLVLLISCANLASLLLVRASGRMREIAIRSALGASQGRIFRQMITESVLLSMIGGVVGLCLAWWCISAVKQWGALKLPRVEGASVNGAVLLFTFLLSIAAGVLFGTAPAWQVLRLSLARTLGEESRGSSGALRRSLTRSLLVVSEVALSAILLVAAGLLLRTYVGLISLDPGFQANNVLCMRTILPSAKYETDESRAHLIRKVVQSLGRIPGVTSAAGAAILPMFPANWLVDFTIADGQNAPPESANYNSITPQYFETIGARIIRGRGFTEADNEQTPPVVIVSESLAKRYFPNQDPVGRNITMRVRQETTTARVVGIARDIALRRLDEKPRAAIYQPHAQRPWPFFFFVVKTTGDPMSVAKTARQVIFDIDPEVPVDRLQPMSALVRRVMAQRELALVLLTGFSALALVLATVGLYSVLTVAVAQRAREIGIRMALGANGGAILRMVLIQGLGLTAAGLAAGLITAPLATQALRQMLFGVKPIDPATFGGVAALMFVTSAIACVVPARRASRVDPGKALRE